MNYTKQLEEDLEKKDRSLMLAILLLPLAFLCGYGFKKIEKIIDGESRQIKEQNANEMANYYQRDGK